MPSARRNGTAIARLRIARLASYGLDSGLPIRRIKLRGQSPEFRDLRAERMRPIFAKLRAQMQAKCRAVEEAGDISLSKELRDRLFEASRRYVDSSKPLKSSRNQRKDREILRRRATDFKRALNRIEPNEMDGLIGSDSDSAGDGESIVSGKVPLVYILDAMIERLQRPKPPIPAGRRRATAVDNWLKEVMAVYTAAGGSISFRKNDVGRPILGAFPDFIRAVRCVTLGVPVLASDAALIDRARKLRSALAGS